MTTDPYTSQEELEMEAPLVPDLGPDGRTDSTTELRLELAEMRAQLERIETALCTRGDN